MYFLKYHILLDIKTQNIESCSNSMFKILFMVIETYKLINGDQIKFVSMEEY